MAEEKKTEAEEVRDAAEAETETPETSEEVTEEAAEAAGAPEAEAEPEEQDADKSLFGKKKKKDKKDEKIEELEDKYKRQLAEFENFRTRSEREKGQMYDMGAKSVIERFLPVIDNFERGLAALTPEQLEADPFAQGIDKVYRQMTKELEAIGVTPIEAVGKELDPNLHNAVMQVETEEYESGVIAQELQKGYKYHDTVVRHSMVAVAQ